MFAPFEVGKCRVTFCLFGLLFGSLALVSTFSPFLCLVLGLLGQFLWSFFLASLTVVVLQRLALPFSMARPGAISIAYLEGFFVGPEGHAVLSKHPA